MKYVKSISLFFVYPLCCFLAGLSVGFSFIEMPSAAGNGQKEIAGNDIVYEQSAKEDGQRSNEEEQRLLKEEQMATQPASDKSESVSGSYIINQSSELQAAQPAAVQDGFFVKNLNNYVVIYYMDQETVFLFTEINVNELPKEVQESLNQGMILPNEGSLYDFLENYTS